MNRKKFIISALIVCIGFAGSFLLMNAKNRNDNTVKEGTSLKTILKKLKKKSSGQIHKAALQVN